ncbi:MAG: hypothetical protein DRQ48_00850 [Gammaproteobacteria bacterium]|nr:MAG: hypothetical protein DRQ44_00520 [Gammaproteobacteria bacterium]RKZ72227.1 MAG: hypothetical protein DRQ48_00850 [Gammaproteobacteria bacterium]
MAKKEVKKRRDVRQLEYFNEVMAKKRAGAPSFPYTESVADEICRLVSIKTVSLDRIIRENPHLPSKDVIYTWRAYNKEFGDKYMKAKITQAQLLADEVLEISDDSTHDEMQDANGNWKLNSEYVARSKLKIHTRQWLAGKLHPRLYGNQLLEQTSDITNTLKELKESIDDIKKDDEKDY